MSGKTALFVLRMLWRDSAATRRALPTSIRQSSTAAFGHNSAISSNALFPGLETLYGDAAEAENTAPFLEPESPEYVRVSRALVPLDTHLPPLPWPTLLPRGESSTPQWPDTLPPAARIGKVYRWRACDNLATLVARQDFKSARAVCLEMKALGIPIHPRPVYLDAATICLQARDKEGFLFWLAFYPSQKARVGYDGLKEQWAPVLGLLIREYGSDKKFINRFFRLCGEKGLLPIIMSALLPHLALIYPPAASRRLLAQGIGKHLGRLTHERYASDEIACQKPIADEQVKGWWEVYIRLLASLGYKAEATALLAKPPHGRPWNDFTMSVVQGFLDFKLIGARGRADALDGDDALDAELAATTEGPDTFDMKRLAGRLDLAVSSETSPSAGVLADLIADVEEVEPSYLPTFQNGFCFGKSDHSKRTIMSRREQIWWHAMMIVHSRKGDMDKVLDIFREHFLWHGFPRNGPWNKMFKDTINRSRSSADSISAPAAHTQERLIRAHPTKQILTTVLPAILSKLPSSQLVRFHEAYLELCPSLPPILQPDKHVHGGFVRAITPALGPDAGKEAIDRILSCGFQPGASSYAAVMFSLLRRGRYDEIVDILQNMEKEVVAHETGITYPPPTAEMHDWLEGGFISREETGFASTVKLMREQYFPIPREVTDLPNEKQSPVVARS